MRKRMRDFALEVYFSRWEFTARYNLAGSDAENMTLDQLLALASAEDREVFNTVSLGYTETFGAPALREEIAHTYDKVRLTPVRRDVRYLASGERNSFKQLVICA